MIGKLLFGLIGLIAVAGVVLGAGLGWAHLSIRRERPALPTPEGVTAVAPADDWPVRVSLINTASQPMPRRAVLDAGSDPRPRAPYAMSHPSFVLEWRDGRILLVDLGMTRDGARAFGRPIETLAGAAPIEPYTSVAERLRDARERVQAVVFTHLHSDHVGGITDLCKGLRRPLRVPMTVAQAERPNYTTRWGLNLLRQTDCVRREVLPNRSLLAVPGFPGVHLIPAAGHTPGSQIVVAHVQQAAGPHTYVFLGDVVNNIDGINFDIGKPFLYGLLIVPEDGERLAQLRGFLRVLRDRFGVSLLVSHDQQQLTGSGLPAF